MITITKMSFLCVMALLIGLPNFSLAQKVNEDEGTLTEFVSPFEIMTLTVDDDETEYIVNQSTEMPKNYKNQDFKVGQKIKIKFIIENRLRIAKEIKVTSDKIQELTEFTGVFEYLDGDFAFVDGRKIILTSKATIECPGKGFFKKDCGCEKTKVYTGLDDKGIKRGAFFTVKGKMDITGVIQAIHVTVRKNLRTDDEMELRRMVEQSYNATGLTRLSAPKGFKAENGLYKGNIKMGNLEYKLHDDIKVQGYVNMVGNRIIPEYAQDSEYVKQNEIYWRFYVIDNGIPNAFAYPNGMVFIHTGLLRLMDNESQLALVLGHEIAHVLYEHSVSRYKKSKLMGSSLITSLVDKAKEKTTTLTNSNTAKVTAKGISHLLIGSFMDKMSPEQLSGLHDKNQETQSDRAGLAYIYLAGYDLREAPKFWLKMKEITKNEGFMNKLKGNALNFLQTNKLNFDQNLFQQVAGQGLDVVSTSMLETVYTSHPLTSKRYDDINYLLSTHYKDVNFSKTLIGKEEYVKYLGTFKN